MYDCTADVIEHQENVRKFLRKIIEELVERQIHHDESKLREPEKGFYDKYKPRLKEVESEFGYGSPQYEALVGELNKAFRVHYDNNRHHPEHFSNGVNGMTLIDLVEMLCDWKAASSQYNTKLNLPANRKRFNVSDQLYEVLENTVRELSW